MGNEAKELEVSENALGMSDEDILNMPEPTDEPIVEDTNDSNKEAEETTEAIADDVDSEGHTDDPEDGDTEDPESGHAAASSDDEVDTGELEEVLEEEEPEELAAEEETGKKINKNPSGKKKNKKSSGEITEEEVSIKSSDDLIKELFTPFRANGKDMQVGSINDARTLMQMGANYNKKMAGLKPNLKLMKMLDNNKLLDEQKLSYLIDLNNKNPEAIAKLIKESGVDPLDIDTDTPTDYTPNTYTVNDKEVDLDSVLEDISDTPSFNDTIDIISNKLDASSKQVLLDTPALITTINDHVASGVYGQIKDIIDQERTFGRLTDLSDLEAYKHVGDVLDKQGAFNQQPQAKSQTPITKQAKTDDPNLRAKKRAASGTKSSPKAKAKGAINPLLLSDEDFMRDAAPMI